MTYQCEFYAFSHIDKSSKLRENRNGESCFAARKGKTMMTWMVKHNIMPMHLETSLNEMSKDEWNIFDITLVNAVRPEDSRYTVIAYKSYLIAQSEHEAMVERDRQEFNRKKEELSPTSLSPTPPILSQRLPSPKSPSRRR